MSPRRRLGTGILAASLLALFAVIAWLDLQAQSTGMLDMALMGGSMTGGAVARFSAIIGKEQRLVGPR